MKDDVCYTRISKKIDRYILETFQVTGEDLIRRSDDNEETLRKRLESYHKDTRPLVDYYKTQSLHKCVDAEKKDLEVWAELASVLAVV